MSRLKYLGQGLALNPALLERMIGQVDSSKYDERLAEDRFSLREVLAHMADLEPVIYGRMELARAYPGTDVPNFDQDAEAIAKDYGSWEISSSLEMFAEERGRTVALYESLSDEETRLTIKHPILGEISIFDLAVFALGHDAYHMEQISQYF